MKKLIVISILCLAFVSHNDIEKLNKEVYNNTHNNIGVHELVEPYDDVMVLSGRPYKPTVAKIPVR